MAEIRRLVRTTSLPAGWEATELLVEEGEWSFRGGGGAGAGGGEAPTWIPMRFESMSSLCCNWDWRREYARRQAPFELQARWDWILAKTLPQPGQ